MSRTTGKLLLGFGIAVVVLALIMVAALREAFRPDVNPAPVWGSNPSPTASVPMPTADQFSLKPRITAQNCFGDAGCAVTVRVEIESGPVLPEGSDYRLSYVIEQIKDGPRIGWLRLKGGTDYSGTAEHVTIATAEDKLTVRAVDVYDS